MIRRFPVGVVLTVAVAVAILGLLVALSDGGTPGIAGVLKPYSGPPVELRPLVIGTHPTAPPDGECGDSSPVAPTGLSGRDTGGHIELRWQPDTTQVCTVNGESKALACGIMEAVPAEFVRWEIYRQTDADVVGQVLVLSGDSVDCTPTHWVDPDTLENRRAMYQVRLVTRSGVSTWSLPVYWPLDTGGPKLFLAGGPLDLEAAAFDLYAHVPLAVVDADPEGLEGHAPSVQTALALPTCSRGLSYFWQFLQPSDYPDPANYRLLNSRREGLPIRGVNSLGAWGGITLDAANLSGSFPVAINGLSALDIVTVVTRKMNGADPIEAESHPLYQIDDPLTDRSSIDVDLVFNVGGTDIQQTFTYSYDAQEPDGNPRITVSTVGVGAGISFEFLSHSQIALYGANYEVWRTTYEWDCSVIVGSALEVDYAN